MGKKSKPKSDAQASAQIQPAATTASNVIGNSDAPVFSADTLTKLTQTIQTNFEKAKNQEKGKNTRPPKDNGRGKKKDSKDNRKEVKVKDLPVGKPAQKSTPPKKKTDAKKKDRTEEEEANGTGTRGKKRARDTDEPKPQHTAPPPKSKPAQPTATAKDVLPLKPGKRGKGKIDKEALLKEIIELGGTQEDLDLVNDVESDSEIEETEFNDSGRAGKGLEDELAGFMKEIGLEGGKFDAVPDEEEGEEEEEWEMEDENQVEGEDEDMGEEEEKSDVRAAPVVAKPLPSDPKSKGSKLLFTPRPDWHAHELPALTPPSTVLTPTAIEAFYTRAKTLLTTENAVYSTSHLAKSSDRQFLSTIMTSGTLTDKISALTLICQESPLHTTKTLETLLGLARKKSRSQAVSAMGAIKDLFASGVVLPPNRKLKFFSKQPGLGSRECTNLHLLVWAYEDWLKNFYFEILKTLETLCSDQLEFARTHAVGYVWELLREKPEQEANLLRLLVNKLGDTDKKVSSKVSFLLLKLQASHPAMKSIIISSIESEVVFRPGNSLHAKYYAIITLNQTILSTREVAVANKLLDLYFAIFTSLLKKDPGEGATGVNSTGLGTHTTFGDGKPTTATGPPHRGGKMSRKAKLRAEAQERGNKFQEEMNAKLISAVLTGVNRAFPFSQVDDEIFQKHIDTLFKITHSGNFNTSIQALMLIFQVANSKQAVSDRFYRTLYESLLDQRLVTSSKQAMYLNLLFRALKVDTQVKRVKAFVKRVIQIATFHQPSFICGVLFLLSELESAIPSLHSLLDTPQETAEDEEEVFRDVPEEGEEKKDEEETEEKKVEYDGRKRDPSYASADRSCLWELLPFLSYYHPSVALFATHLLEKRKMPSKPDLGMHTLTHFLDRFVYRNAKLAASPGRGSSIMQPLAGGDTRGMVLSTRGTGKSAVPVNSDVFWKRKVEDVAVDEVFFHKYFNNAASRKGVAAAKASHAEDSEAEEEQNEEEIWKALVGSRPELEGDDAESGGVDFDDDGDDGEMDVDDDDDEDENDASTAKDEVDGESGEESEEGPDFADDGDDVWDDEDDVPDDLQKAFEAELEVASKKKAKELEAVPKDDEVDDRKKKRRKLKNLPMFASADDYAGMLSD